MSKQVALYFEILLLVGIPLYLFSTQNTLFASRPLLMGLGGLYCLLRLSHSCAHWPDLGFTSGQFMLSLRDLVIPSLLIIASVALPIILTSGSTRLWLIGQDPLSIPHFGVRLASYIFFSAPIQELIFRGYFTWRLLDAGVSRPLLWTLSVAIFTVVHVPFHSPILLLATFLMGIFYLRNFLHYRNLWAVTLAHAATGTILLIVRNFYLPYT